MVQPFQQGAGAKPRHYGVRVEAACQPDRHGEGGSNRLRSFRAPTDSHHHHPFHDRGEPGGRYRHGVSSRQLLRYLPFTLRLPGVPRCGSEGEAASGMKALRGLFQFDKYQTTLSREFIAGLTTFTTMSYIVVVNPAILSVAGIPREPSFVATVAAAMFGCVLMGLYANRPFAVAPYMGENAFIAFTVCQQMGYKWQTALAAIFVAGVVFVLMTLLRLRQWIVEAVPLSLRYSFAIGIGLFLTFIGLNRTGIVALGVAGAPVRSGHLASAPVLVAVAGFVILAVLVIRKVPGAILLGILITAGIAFAVGVASPPHKFVSSPPSLAP